MAVDGVRMQELRAAIAHAAPNVHRLLNANQLAIESSDLARFRDLFDAHRDDEAIDFLMKRPHRTKQWNWEIIWQCEDLAERMCELEIAIRRYRAALRYGIEDKDVSPRWGY